MLEENRPHKESLPPRVLGEQIAGSTPTMQQGAASVPADCRDQRVEFLIESLVEQKLKSAIETHNEADTIAALKELAEPEVCEALGLPQKFMQMLVEAHETKQFELLSDSFADQSFIGETGKFLFAAPYAINRHGRRYEEPSFLFGSVVSHASAFDKPGVKEALADVHLTVDEVTRIVPVKIQAAAGAVCGEGGEAFVVPDGWCFTGSERGPAINNLTEQRRRYLESGVECINKIFTKQSAKLITDLINAGEQEHCETLYLEYQYHEVGHSSGFPLQDKIRAGLLTNFWVRAMDEWRADGISFATMTKVLSAEELGKACASTLGTRFGIDAHREGGMEVDVDVNVALLLFDRMIQSGCICEDNGQLTLRAQSYEELGALLARQIQDTLEITAAERVLYERYRKGEEVQQAIHGVYGSSIRIEPSSREMFERLVRQPCKGMYASLK